MANYYSKGYQSAANKAGATDTASVKKIQQQLNAAGANITVDGIWGANTQAAYTQFGSNLTSGGSTKTVSSEATTSSTSTANPYLSQLEALVTSIQNSNNAVSTVSENPYLSQLQSLVNQVQESTYTPTQADNPYLAQIEQLIADQKNSQYIATEYSNPYGEKLLELTAPKTDEEYRTQAENYYMPQHNAQVEALTQANEKEQLGYQQQLEQLATAMQDSREATNATYAKNISDLNNSMLRKGMARSSYAAQTEANARTGWAEALSKVERDYLANVNNIGAQQQLATSQLAQSVARLESDLATNIANYEATLRSNDKAAQIQAYEKMSESYDSWQQQQEQLKAASEEQRTANILALTQYLAGYQQDENQFNAQMQADWQSNKDSLTASLLQAMAGYKQSDDQFNAQMQADAQQQQTSNVATLLQFLANYQQSEDQFNQQMQLSKDQWEWQKAQANKTTSGTPKSKEEPEEEPTKSYGDWNTFNETTASAYSTSGTKKVSNTDSEFYSAAAQYALEQIEKQLRGW